MIDAFGMVPGTAVLAANDACHEANLRLVELFHRVPLLCTPTVAGQTGPVGEQGTIDGQPDIGWVSMTYPFNMTRSPAGTVCAGFTSDGMPVGLQVVGPQQDRKSVVEGKSVSVRLDPGGRRITKKKTSQ